MLLYDVLGVAPTATQADIKAAYRRIARELHPDATNGDPAKAKRWDAVQQAYRVLSDPTRRARYDGTSTGQGTPPDPAVAAATERLTTAVLQHTEDLGQVIITTGFERLKRWVKRRIGGGGR